MTYNLWRTARQGQFVPDVEVQAAPLSSAPVHEQDKKVGWGHRALESRPMLLAGLALVAVAIGGLVEFVPMWIIKENVPTISSVKAYTPLEVIGRDIYIREGCVGCHSQMIRPFRSETERYGEYSKAGEYVYDHPFLWGSKRTGPDLHRIGGKYPDAWHYNHMDDPRLTSPGSLMPRYSWLLTQKIETNSLAPRLSALRKVGVPYPAGFENGAAQKNLVAQSQKIVANLKRDMITNAPANTEIIALIAYLQRLGTDIKVQAAAK
jgi:cytochrome c oxidase cbb3-type subunit I/II